MKFYVACVDLFGVRPPVEECDEVEAVSSAAAAEHLHRSLNEDSTLLEVEVIAVARAGRGRLKWEYFESKATVSYSLKSIDLATASKAAAA